MTVKKNSFVNFIVGFFIAGIILFIIFGNSGKSNINTITPASYSEGKQIIDLTAKGGFSPNTITAKANVETILNVITNKTFDCSSSIRIPKLNISENLPLTGTTQIALGSYNSGEEIDGTCLMGMYNFKIKFI